MRVLVFEDDAVRRLHPLTLGRLAFALPCGGRSLLDLVQSLGVPVRAAVRGYLQEALQAEYSELASASDSTGPTLLVNARMVPSEANRKRLHEAINAVAPLCLAEGHELLLARVDEQRHGTLLSTKDAFCGASIVQRASREGWLQQVQGQLIRGPHELVACHLATFRENLHARLSVERPTEVAEGVYRGDAQPLGSHVVANSSAGPIVIEPDVHLGPFVTLIGPLLLRSGARVSPQGVLQGFVDVGRGAKVGGEIGASVIGDYSNKQHHGYLGHAYLGRWVNLGAGTSNSNLKNTYGTVRIETDGEKLDTGMQFLGCMIGDYAKTAINTSIFTGKRIGAASMVYGFVTTDVPSFVNYARSLGDVTRLSPQVVAQTQRRVLARRGKKQPAWQVRLIEAMYEQLAPDRELADRPISL